MCAATTAGCLAAAPQRQAQGQSKASAAEGTGKQEEKVVPEEKQAKEDHEEAKEETVQIKMKQEVSNFGIMAISY